MILNGTAQRLIQVSAATSVATIPTITNNCTNTRNVTESSGTGGGSDRQNSQNRPISGREVQRGELEADIAVLGWAMEQV